MNFGETKMFDGILTLFYYLKQKTRTPFISRDKLEKWQNKKVQAFIKKIVKKSTYYNKKYKSYDIKDWKKLPLINKEEMMNHFNELNTVHIKKEDAFNTAYKAEQDRDFTPKINNITVGLSSGTSGNRGIFLASGKERYMWAGTVLAKLLPSSILGQHKIAFFLRCDSNLYQTVQNRHVTFEYFDLLHPIQEHITRLNLFQPTILVAPPSLLRLLVENGKQLNIKPQKIISVAEVLEDIDKQMIEHFFKKKLHQVYQATEGFIAASCPYGTLHLNEDLMVIEKEFIDEKRFIPIITDFNRTSQPILRYRLNDILTISEKKCPCGSIHLAIEKIEGRCDDIFYFKSKTGNHLVPVFPDFISRAIICSTDKITDYKVKQINQDLIEVYTNIENYNFYPSLHKLCKKLNCITPKIKYTSINEKQLGKKYKRIERVYKVSGNDDRII